MDNRSFKTVVITGAHSGLGFEVARKIAAHQEFRVILACRNREKGEQVSAQIRAETGKPNTVCMVLDTASLDSVCQFEKLYTQAGYADVSALLCNAGISGTHTGITKDGFDVVFQINHLGASILVHSRSCHTTRKTLGNCGRKVKTRRQRTKYRTPKRRRFSMSWNI